MELDLQKFYNINRRILMWVAFFGVLLVLRDFFAVMFLTFVFAFLMAKVAAFFHRATRAPYWVTVTVPYLVVLGLLGLLITKAAPSLKTQAVEFATHKLPVELHKLAVEIKKTAANSGFEAELAKYVNEAQPQAGPGEGRAAESTSTQPASEEINVDALQDKLLDTILSFIPGAEGGDPKVQLPLLVKKFVTGVVVGTSEFLLAVLLSFLIVLDSDRIKRDLQLWAQSPIGRFFAEAASSVVNFSLVVGSAFQCQLAIASLNATITCLGMILLRIEPLLLLTTIVWICGLIPVLGVFISSVPIVLIAFNKFGLMWALLTVGMITLVHMLEAYVFNPRIYGAWFHLNPVIVLIILLVAHKLGGVWGMLLGIPITHYLLNVVQAPGSLQHRPALRKPPDESPPP